MEALDNFVESNKHILVRENTHCSISCIDVGAEKSFLSCDCFVFLHSGAIFDGWNNCGKWWKRQNFSKDMRSAHLSGQITSFRNTCETIIRSKSLSKQTPKMHPRMSKHFLTFPCLSTRGHSFCRKKAPADGTACHDVRTHCRIYIVYKACRLMIV